MPIGPSAFVVAGLLAVGLGACGGDDEGAESVPPAAGDERERVVAVVRRWQDATLERDPDAFCEPLTGNAKAEIIAPIVALGGEADCESAAERIFDLGGADDFERVRQARKRLGPEDVRVRGSRATVRLSSGRTVGMKRAGSRWLVDDPPGRT